MQGLHAALELYFQDGVDAALRRHQRLSRAVKDGVARSGSICSARARGQLDGDGDPRPGGSAPMRSATGSGRTSDACSPRPGSAQGKVFRIGHFGYVSELDIIRGLAALEMTLERLDHPVKRGAAVARRRAGCSRRLR